MASAQQQRAADEVAGRRGPGPVTPGRFLPGVVTAVTAGAAADGNALVTVNCDGTITAAAYNAAYTPVVGHVVLLAVQGASRTILCRVVGTP